MSSDEQMNAVLRAWREGVRGKERRAFRLEERIELRMQAIEQRMRHIRIPLDDWEIRQFRYHGPGKTEDIDREWRPFRVGDQWGGPDVSAYLRSAVTIPDELGGKPVVLRLSLGGDSLVSVNGVPHHGLDIFRNELPLTPNAKAGERYELMVESYVHWHAGEPDIHTLGLSELVYVDPETNAAYWDFRAAVKMFAIDDLDPGLRAFLETSVWGPLKEVPIDEPDGDEFTRRLRHARERLRRGFYESDRFRGEGLMHMVGHSHLDLVFLWTYGEFIRKVGRTHATMLRLIEQYPEFKFAQSQAKLYADMKEHYPALFDQVKRRVQEGRWEPLGAFWIEPDCNLISGESFVRQIMQGQMFWQREFGMRSRICWQPDVFGVSWAMPQILRRCGIDFFMTNKMAVWNDTNRWAKNTFWWEGPDGSRVLCVVPPGHFIGTVDPDQMSQQWAAFSDKATIGESLYCYGWGDGGGGVDPEMLECGRRYRDLPGLVRTSFSTALEAFESIQAKAETNPIPVVNDELYLEAHRGTYTSRARLKDLNRRSEFLLREAEALSALAWVEGAEYPLARLNDVWREVLTNQFHDALPGTHIAPVYQDLLDSYRVIFDQLGGIRGAAAGQLLSPQTGPPEALAVFNTFLHPRRDLLRIPSEQVTGRALVDESGVQLTTQSVMGLDSRETILAQNPGIPSLGYRCFQLAERPATAAAQCAVQVGSDWLENKYLRARFNQDGELVSLWDKEVGREVIAEGRHANVFQMYQDTPGKYDAWDIVASYVEHEIALSDPGKLSVDETGPLRASLRLNRPCRRSAITQRISLESGSRVLKFETRINWVERQTLLKVAFPVEINARDATYDMAYGSMTRPTHRNTSFDEARFEVPAHKWMDLSEEGYGVSLLNDCKYGHEAHGNVMRLTLLKGPVYPDADSDMEEHTFTYGLYPHAGRWGEAGTVQLALDLNHPCFTSPTGIVDAGGTSWMSCRSDHVTLEAVKRSEDGQHLIVRLAEQHGSRQPIDLEFGCPIRGVWSCNLMEETEQEIRSDERRAQVSIKPFEVVTLRILTGGPETIALEATQ